MHKKYQKVAISEQTMMVSATANQDVDVKNDMKTLIHEIGHLQLQLFDQQDASTKEDQKLFFELLDVLDGFERIFDTITKKQEKFDHATKILIGNFRTIYRLLCRIIDDHGVIEIASSENTLFEPQWQQVASKVYDPSRLPNMIIATVKRGYRYKDHVLRKASVSISTDTPLQETISADEGQNSEKKG